MPLDKGSTALTIFRLEKPLPDDALERFSAKKAIKYDETGLEDETGWVSGRHLLERRIDDETSILGGAYNLNMRVTKRVVPPALQRALCRERELEYMRERSTDFVPKNVKKEISEFVVEKHIHMIPPALSGVSVAVDRVGDFLFVGTSSGKALDMLLTLFYDTFEIDPEKLDFANIASRIPGAEDVTPKVDFSEISSEEDYIPGRDLLTWLWYRGDNEIFDFTAKDGTEFKAVISGPLTLAMVDPDEGASEAMIKKGAPERSVEAKSALAIGKKLKKAKLTISEKDRVWEGGFSADLFNFTGLKLPATEKGGDADSTFEERMRSLRFLVAALEAIVEKFINELKSDDWDAKLKEIQAWAATK